MLQDRDGELTYHLIDYGSSEFIGIAPLTTHGVMSTTGFKKDNAEDFNISGRCDFISLIYTVRKSWPHLDLSNIILMIKQNMPGTSEEIPKHFDILETQFDCLADIITKIPRCIVPEQNKCNNLDKSKFTEIITYMQKAYILLLSNTYKLVRDKSKGMQEFDKSAIMRVVFPIVARLPQSKLRIYDQTDGETICNILRICVGADICFS